MYKWKTYLFISLLFPWTAALSQVPPPENVFGSSNITNQIWLDYNPTYVLSNKFTVYGDLDARTIFPNVWYRFVAGTGLKYDKGKLFFKKTKYVEELHGGLRFFYTLNKYSVNRLEIRFFQGYKLKWPFVKKFSWDNYIRLEERVELNPEYNTYYFGFRLRWLSGLTYTIKDANPSGNKNTYLSLAAEAFLTMIQTKQQNDLFRVITGLGRVFNERWRAELNLGLFLTRQTVENKFQTDDFVFRLRVFHKIP